jgi:argininosuccinate lyase
VNNKKPWSGRFKEKTNELVDAFTASISYDARLLEYDIKASIAHANSLKKAGVLTEAQCKDITRGLGEILADKASGKLKLNPELEDIHMNIEARLVDKIGEVGKKLHTGRSRNDQAVTALRLWLKDQINQISSKIKDLQKALLDSAEKNLDIIMPGYTSPIIFWRIARCWRAMLIVF